MFVEFDKKYWDKVANKSLNYSFYQSTHYAGIFEKVEGTRTRCFMLLDNQEVVKVAGIGIEKENQITFEFGPLIYKSTSAKDVEEFLNYVQGKCHKKVKFTMNMQFEKYYGDSKKYSTYFSFSTLVLDIPKTEQEFLSGCNENRRRIIKKVKDRDFQIETDKSNLTKFYQIYCQRLIDNKAEEIPPTYEFFKAILDDDCGKLFVCKKDNEIYSGILGFMFNKYFETRYNTNNTKFIKENAGTYLDYSLIKDFINTREVERYDFAGYSENAEGKFLGINTYKASYGGKINSFDFKEKK